MRKKLLTILSVALLVQFLTVSCTKETQDRKEAQDGGNSETNLVISLDTDNMEFTAENGTKSFNIKSNTSWKLLSNADWCQVSPSSGSNNGTATVRVSMNTLPETRTATILVISEAGIPAITITQSGAETLSLDVSTMEFASGSGSKIFRISSNTSWAVSSDCSWCSISPTSGNGDGNVTVSVDENTFTTSRTAKITVESSSISHTLTVMQDSATPTPSFGQDRTFTVGGVTFKMIAVEGGTFTMGATSEQGSDADYWEKPTHSVTLSNYYIGETEVTQGLWVAVTGSEQHYYYGGEWSSTYGLGSNYPAYYISFDDSESFIYRLNEMTGEHFRMPTEAEWEFAARGGNKSRGCKYAGSNYIDDVAWYKDNSSNTTHIVGTKLANELGIYDMSGNVTEMCSDSYEDYSQYPKINPTNYYYGDMSVRRGGGFDVEARGCRVSTRWWLDDPDYAFPQTGLRLVLEY